MVNNAEIVQCEFCEEDVLEECTCSDYYLNCADVCELLFLKRVILVRLLDCRQLVTVIDIHVQPYACKLGLMHHKAMTG